MTQEPTSTDTLDIMQSRKSARAFPDKPDSREQAETILEAAREAGVPDNPDYHYYPEEWFEPYRSRRKEMGLTMYAAMGITREDKDRRIKAWNNNYRFFGAPAALLLLFVDRGLATGSWMDMGMFIQNVMLAAGAVGLATCPQALLADISAGWRAEINSLNDVVVDTARAE